MAGSWVAEDRFERARESSTQLPAAGLLHPDEHGLADADPNPDPGWRQTRLIDEGLEHP